LSNSYLYFWVNQAKSETDKVFAEFLLHWTFAGYSFTILGLGLKKAGSFPQDQLQCPPMMGNQKPKGPNYDLYQVNRQLV